MIFLPLSALNTNFLEQKASTFFDPKRLKHLSVNALRFNQQTLFIHNLCDIESDYTAYVYNPHSAPQNVVQKTSQKSKVRRK
ncbi:hypothetical protein [Okeania sp. KiyG1]|uniref:hypothetical protein n=1 Tax=Okeania sp. KiyG1 TaxID=2720165 RepID=UPI001923246B|nr:hypothetical protein [Okeania sp. KiyG1]GFZ96157.1 hypothetical protein CYANOKiyG1_07290 [Okeania sp. KiyG1]